MKLTKYIASRPGWVPIETVNEWFQKMARDTSSIKSVVKLDTIDTGPHGIGYGDELTHHLWIGFAIGLKLSEDIQRTGNTILEAAERGVI